MQLNSPLMLYRGSVMVRRFGSWSMMRERGTFTTEGVCVIPEMEPEDYAEIDEWAIQNYHRLWPDEKRAYKTRYLAWRRANNPTLLDRVREFLR